MLKQTPGNPASHIANADKTQSRIFIGEQLIYLSNRRFQSPLQKIPVAESIRLAGSCLELPGLAESRLRFFSVQTQLLDIRLVGENARGF